MSYTGSLAYGVITVGLTQTRATVPAALRCLAVHAYCLRQRALLEQFCVSPKPNRQLTNPKVVT